MIRWFFCEKIEEIYLLSLMPQMMLFFFESLAPYARSTLEASYQSFTCFDTYTHTLASGLHMRYDIFILEDLFSQVEDPADMYEKLRQHVRSGLEDVTLKHVPWETDLNRLRDEVLDNANTNCGLSPQEISEADLDDWLRFLSEDELRNYNEYLQILGMTHTPKEDRTLRAVCVGQNPAKDYVMMGTELQLPTFTKDSTKRILLTSLDRWITASEKMAVTGFPSHQDCFV